MVGFFGGRFMGASSSAGGSWSLRQALGTEHKPAAYIFPYAEQNAQNKDAGDHTRRQQKSTKYLMSSGRGVIVGSRRDLGRLSGEHSLPLSVWVRFSPQTILPGQSEIAT
jgi:hypothetical protein